MKIEELLAREAIRHTISRYTRAGDAGRLDELAACFAEDGSFEIEGEEPCVGRAAIVERLKPVAAGTSSRPPRSGRRPFVHHHVSSVFIELDGAEAAHARSYFFVVTEIGPDHWGRYRDRLVRRDDHWLFAHRHIRIAGASPDSRMARRWARKD